MCGVAPEHGTHSTASGCVAGLRQIVVFWFAQFIAVCRSVKP